jgi:hypothetical protein
MTAIARAVSIVFIVHMSVVLLCLDVCEVSRGAQRFRLMRQGEKKDRIQLAEGLSNGRVPKCATTAFTASNHGLLKLVTN